MLDVSASDKGVLIPRVQLNDVTTQAPISAAPVEGLLIYNSSGSEPAGYYYWDGGQWLQVATGSGGLNTNLTLNGNILELTDPGGTLTQDLSSLGSYWHIDGNSNIGAGNFLGTTNSNPLRVRTDNTERMRVTAAGEIGLFDNAPAGHFISYINPGTLGSGWQVDFTNDGSGNNALLRVENTQADNGARNFLGVTNYNSSTYEAPGVMGLALNNSLSASATFGVLGHNNSDEGTGVLGRFTGGNSVGVGGWALYGSGWSGGTTAWQNMSDRRLKKDVRRLEDPLEKIQAIRGVHFSYDTEKYGHLGLKEGKRVGFIAQEVEEVFPYLVRDAHVPGNPGQMDKGMKGEASGGTFKSLGYASLVPVLLEGVKAQQDRIEELEGCLKELEARMAELEEKE